MFRQQTKTVSRKEGGESCIPRITQRIYFVLLTAFLLSFAPAICAAQFALSLDGRRIDPLKSNAGHAVVLLFVRGDCPISGRYAPTIQRISREYQNDVRFYLVFPDKSETPQNIRKYLRDYGYAIPALRDPEHALVKQSHAEITPSVAVFNAGGALIYHGRIDNLYVSFGRARPAPTTHELEEALRAALAGRSPQIPEVSGVGCYISDL
jgi:thiol-disulfide isomerase/thioredoxin